MKVSVIGGAGYVGLITALGSSSMGHDVISTDIDEKKVKNLNNNIPPIYEESLDSLLKFCNLNNKISFTTDNVEAIQNSELIIVSVGTPTKSNGEIDFTYDELDEELIEGHQIIINCTPLGTHPNVDQKPNIPYHHLNSKHYLFDLVYRPEKTAFLKEGEARGSRICNGAMMLKWQAEKSWEIWNSL